MKNIELKITCATSFTANDWTTFSMTWSELKDELRYIHEKGVLSLAEYLASLPEEKKLQKAGAAWLPCSLIEEADGRTSSNIYEAYLMVLDIDVGMSLETIQTTLAPFEYAIHSTYSHTLEKPKWRVVMPFIEPVSPADLSLVFDYFNELFKNQLDKLCGHDASRMYYLPRCPADAESLFTFLPNEGQLIDGAKLADYRRSTISKAERRPLATKLRSKTSFDPFLIGVGEGERNAELTKRAYQCFRDGLNIDSAREKCAIWNQLNEPPLPEREINATLKSVFKTSNANAILVGDAVDDVIKRMNSQFVWVGKYNRVYRHEYRDFVTVDALKSSFANTSVTIIDKGVAKQVSHAEAWMKSPKRCQLKDIVFAPGQGDIVKDCINLWQGWPFEALEGDIKPWTTLLDHLFSGDIFHRTWFEQWFAYPIQHPGTKLKTAVAMWSARQGVGKSLIGETVGQLYGPSFRTITAAELHGQYNNWTRECQFVLGEENSSADRRADSNKLKHLITGRKITVSEKYQPGLEMDNVMNFLFTSNHPDAFHLEEYDRRFFVWEICSQRLGDEFYADFVEWRDKKGGAAALMQHFATLDLSTFNPSANAPVTAAKSEMISQSKTSIERWLADATDDENIETIFGRDVVSVEDMAKIYALESDNKSNPTAMGRAISRSFQHAKRKISLMPGRKNVISLKNHGWWESADSAEWVREYKKPRTVSLH